jgi:predicted GTPase
VASLGDLRFRAVDTSGLEPGPRAGRPRPLAAAVTAATQGVLAEATVAVLLLDARTGVVPADGELAAWLRARGAPAKPLVVAALTKADAVSADALEAAAVDARLLGFGDPVAVSAATGVGLADLHAALAPAVDAAAAAAPAPPPADPENPAGPVRVALVGLPNAGKSSLANALLGRARAVADAAPGTTRDAVHASLEYRGRRVELVDTAGWDAAVARRGPSAGAAPATAPPSSSDDAFILASSLAQTRRWLNLAHVVVLVTDAAAAAARAAADPAPADAPPRALSRAEVQLLGAAATAGRAVVLVANKVDLLPKGVRTATAAALAADAGARAPRVAAAPALALSATTGDGLGALLPAIVAAHTAWATRLSTGALNRWLAASAGGGSARPGSRPRARTGNGVPGELARVRYLAQASARPPSFVAFTAGGSLSESARRAIVNRLRAEHGFGGVPLRVTVRGREGGKRG